MDDPEAIFLRALASEMDEALEEHQGSIPPLLVFMWANSLRSALPLLARGQRGAPSVVTIPTLL